MSVHTFTSSLLAVKPKVWVEDGVLHARTSLLMQVLSLGSHSKHVAVDPSAHNVRIESRSLWFLQSVRDVAFDDILYIDYSFHATGTSWGGAWTQFQRQDQVERFKVSLVLDDERETHVHLFNFTGEGAVQTGTFGVLMGGDSWFDAAGDQDAASLDYIELLCAATGKKLTKPWEYADRIQNESPHRCTDCGRGAMAGRATCYYCGGAIMTLEDGDDDEDVFDGG